MKLKAELEAALQVAMGEAARRQHTYAGLEHLLFALCHDPDSATLINSGAGNTSNLCPQGDVDWFKIQNIRGTTIQFTLYHNTYSATSFTAQACLYAATNTKTPLTCTSGQKQSETLTYGPVQDSSYYVRVSELAWQEPNDQIGRAHV